MGFWVIGVILVRQIATITNNVLMHLYKLLSLCAMILNGSGILIYILTRKKQTVAMAFLATLLAASVASDFVGAIVPGVVPNIAGNLYTLVEITAIVFIYKSELRHDKKWPMTAVLVILLCIQLYQMIIFPGIREFPSVSRTALSIVVTVFCLLFFFRVMRDPPSGSLTRLPMFWINVGMLTYYGGNMFLFIVRDYLVYTLKDTLVQYWILHNVLVLFWSIFLFTALLLQSRSSQQHEVQP